jgi:hypothetical protein
MEYYRNIRLLSEAPPPKEEEPVQPFAAASPEEFVEGERTHA